MEKQSIKLVVWDLDETIWKGILSEDVNVTLREGIAEIIETLDKRGILQSISSKNDYDLAFEKLKEFHLDEYFIYPKINWNPKSDNIKQIIKEVNFASDAVAFVDDQQFELDEVKFAIQDILCLSADKISDMLEMDEFIPRFITKDSAGRRKLYLNDITRNQVEESFVGTQEEFLQSLGMKMVISYAKEDDLPRVEELTVRTHQLNSTGYTYSYEELVELIKNPEYKVLVVGLDDKYGTYGKIGLVVMKCTADTWHVELLLTSCRVMSRGIGGVLLDYIILWAKESKVKLLAEFVRSDRNRIMYLTYKMKGFKELSVEGNHTLFQLENDMKLTIPDYVEIKFDEK